MESLSTESSAKAVGAVLGVIAMVAGVYGMVQPMQQRIDHGLSELRDLKMEFENHRDKQELLLLDLASRLSAVEATCQTCQGMMRLRPGVARKDGD